MESNINKCYIPNANCSEIRKKTEIYAQYFNRSSGKRLLFSHFFHPLQFSDLFL